MVIHRRSQISVSALTLSLPNLKLFLFCFFIFFVCVCVFFFSNYCLERSLFVKLKDWTSNSVDPDEPSYLYVCCLQKTVTTMLALQHN